MLTIRTTFCSIMIDRRCTQAVRFHPTRSRYDASDCYTRTHLPQNSYTSKLVLLRKGRQLGLIMTSPHCMSYDITRWSLKRSCLSKGRYRQLLWILPEIQEKLCLKWENIIIYHHFFQEHRNPPTGKHHRFVVHDEAYQVLEVANYWHKVKFSKWWLILFSYHFSISRTKHFFSKTTSKHFLVRKWHQFGLILNLVTGHLAVTD